MKTKATIIASLTLIMLNVVWGAFGQEGVTVVPEIFLRGYDPITVFFPDTVAQHAEGRSDHPSELLEIMPEHPGEYRWLDGKNPTVTAHRALASLATLHANCQRCNAHAGYLDGSPNRHLAFQWYSRT